MLADINVLTVHVMLRPRMLVFLQTVAYDFTILDPDRATICSTPLPQRFDGDAYFGSFFGDGKKTEIGRFI